MTEPLHRRTILSTLWAFVAINIAYADILGLFSPGMIEAVASGVIEGVTMTDGLLLIAAGFLQIALVMMVAVQVLPPRAGRWVNTGAALVTTLFIIGGGSLKPHYILFATMEVAALTLIVILSWRWARA
ncbi:MAG: DUF6326 family protein [Shimia sp.]